MRRLLQSVVVVGVAAAGMFAAATPVVGEPSFGSDAALPIPGTASDTILEPAPGSPVLGPVLPPPATVYPSLLAPLVPPGAGEVDDFSYGDEFIFGGPPSMIEFSVGPGAFGASIGHPGAPAPPPPLFDVRIEAGVVGPPPFGDGSVDTDIFATWPGPIPGPTPCAPLGFSANVQILDGDGAAGPPYGPPRRGRHAAEPGSNVDAYDRGDDTVVNRVPGVPLEAPVFFTIDAATAAGWPAGPIPAPGGGAAVPGPGDILAFNPAFGGPVIWATAGALGLIVGDDVDALAVTYVSGTPLPPFGPGWDFLPAGDGIMFSLAPGSPSLAPTSGGAAATPLAGCAPGPVAGTGTAADLWFVMAPVPVGGAAMYINAEAIGLDTVRSGGPGDDNIDAIDMCNTMVFSDIDGDFIDDGCDMDMDGDGTGNGIDPDDDGDGFGDPQQTLHRGPSNADATKDNCPAVPNPAQTNTDGNFVDNSPPLLASNDDKTWPNSDMFGDACDSDDDNDGISDTDEGSGAACAGFVTNPLVRDTDLDRALDGAECSLGTDPTLSTSKPTQAACGANVDSDGDKVKDWSEFCGYNTSNGSTDTDGDIALDGAKDGCEATSLNGDRVVNSGDQLLMVLEFLREPSPSLRLHSYDINKDGAVNSGDQLIIVGFISPSGQCP